MPGEAKGILLALLAVLSIVSLVLGVPFLATACNPADAEEPSPWTQAEPPPNAPAGVECWVWNTREGTSAAYGGPYCFVPDQE